MVDFNVDELSGVACIVLPEYADGVCGILCLVSRKAAPPICQDIYWVCIEGSSIALSILIIIIHPALSYDR